VDKPEPLAVVEVEVQIITTHITLVRVELVHLKPSAESHMLRKMDSGVVTTTMAEQVRLPRQGRVVAHEVQLIEILQALV
jgi:hypothetical protein